MADEQGASTAPRYFEDPAAPVIYTDGCWGGGPMAGDNITLTFSAKVLDNTQNPPQTVIKTMVRLVMPRGAAADAATFIQKLLGDLAAGAAEPQSRTLN